MKKLIVFIFIILVIIMIYCGIKFKNNNIEEYDQSKKLEEGMAVTLIGGSNMAENGNVNSCGYIVRSKNGKLIIVDGGRDIDARFVLNYINEYGNGKVDDWFITHPHGDHVGALVKLLQEENIEVENLYHSFLTDEWYKENDNRGYESEHLALEELDNPKIKNVISCEKDQIIKIDNIDCEIIRIANPDVTDSDNGNESSMVFKFIVTDVNKTMLFLGDALRHTSKELLEEPERLKSDAVQMAHHGQNGVYKEVYDAIDAKYCFFNCPEWLYNNDNGGGYDSGNWQSITVRKWMSERDTTNYLAFEGDQTVLFTSNGIYKEN